MEDRYLTTAQGELRYITGGSGPPVLMLHALQMAASADTWSKHFDLISKSHTYFALDTIGWGFSELKDEYDFDVWIESLNSFCDELGLDQVDLIGLSLGSWISQLFALRYPHRVRRIAALASPGLNPSLPYDPRTLSSAVPSRERLAASGLNVGEIDRIEAMLGRPNKMQNLIKLFTYLSDPDARERWTLKTTVSQLKPPIFYGNWDTNKSIPPKYTIELFNLAPNSRLEITTGNSDDLFAPAARFLSAELAEAAK